MSQQYRKVNMTEVARVLDAMSPGEGYTSDYLANAAGMNWRRATFALLKAEEKGLIEVVRPTGPRARNGHNLYWKVTKDDEQCSVSP